MASISRISFLKPLTTTSRSARLVLPTTKGTKMKVRILTLPEYRAELKAQYLTRLPKGK